ncbi:MAG: type II toxin-antitoxin system RelE family toxin [Puniceicoccaceae bacterium]
MNSKVAWSAQVADYLRGKAPGPRRDLLHAIKALADWDGRENPPEIRHLEDELSGYSRLRVGHHRVVFRETAMADERFSPLFVAPLACSA